MIYLVKDNIVLSTENWEERSNITIEEHSKNEGFDMVETPDSIENININHFIKTDLGWRFDESKSNTKLIESLLKKARKTRQKCFSVINRGQIWYNNLTENQLEELNNWYIEWCDFPSKQELTTDKLEYPKIPEWLDIVYKKEKKEYNN